MSDRRKGIGGTDIGAIIGVNPWKNKMDVYLEKVGITEPPEDNENMWWGREMEPVLKKRYEKEKGLKTDYPIESPMVHSKFPWYLGSPDDLVYIYGRLAEDDPANILEGGVDYKTTSRRQDYGEAGSDVVPDFVATQCHWYMGLTGAQWWDVAVLFMGYRREFAIFHLERNQEIIDNLTEAGREFWEGHVLPQIPPELDASDASQKLLRSLYPESGGEVIPAPSDAMTWRISLEQASEEVKKWEERKKLAQHHLEMFTGNAEGLLWPDGWRFTWKYQKGSTYTVTKQGGRVARLWPPKEKK